MDNNLTKLNGQIVTNEQLEEIELDSNVEYVQNLGNSGKYYNCTWFNVKFFDGKEIDVYLRTESTT